MQLELQNGWHCSWFTNQSLQRYFNHGFCPHSLTLCSRSVAPDDVVDDLDSIHNAEHGIWARRFGFRLKPAMQALVFKSRYLKGHPTNSPMRPIPCPNLQLYELTTLCGR
eukprot:482201-Amphidinium_carterae.1